MIVDVYQSTSDVQVQPHCGFLRALHANSFSQKKQPNHKTEEVKTFGH